MVAGNITFCGIGYTCDELRQYFLHGSQEKVAIRVDQQDLGWISVKIGRNWYPAQAVPQGFNGRSLLEWMHIGQQLRQRYQSEALLTEPVVEDAFKRIDQTQRTALKRQERTMALPSAEEIDRNEDRLFSGISIITSQQPSLIQDMAENSSPLGIGMAIPLLASTTFDHPDTVEAHEGDSSEDDNWTFEDE